MNLKVIVFKSKCNTIKINNAFTCIFLHFFLEYFFGYIFNRQELDKDFYNCSTCSKRGAVTVQRLCAIPRTSCGTCMRGVAPALCGGPGRGGWPAPGRDARWLPSPIFSFCAQMERLTKCKTDKAFKIIFLTCSVVRLMQFTYYFNLMQNKRGLTIFYKLHISIFCIEKSKKKSLILFHTLLQVSFLQLAYLLYNLRGGH